jgi:serine kinase
MPTTECAINPVAINGVMATQLSHRNSDMNASKQKIGYGNYQTVHLAHKLLTYREDQGTSSVGQVLCSAENTLNAEETRQSATENLDDPDTPDTVTDISDLKRKGYVMCKKIGKGKFATVHHVYYTDRTSSKKVRMACKILKKEVQQDDMKELDILKKIQHPHIIHVHEILRCRSKVFIFMELADNGDLLGFIKHNGEVPEHQAKTWFLQMASAVQYLHSNNIAHRDLKCENILLSSEFDIKLADFGFACFCVNRDSHCVLSKTFCGTAAYAPPEILKGIPYNPKLADVWSLGVILFTMLNAILPFDDSHLHKIYKNQMDRKFEFEPRVRNTLSVPAVCAVMDMLEPDMMLRPNIDEVMAHQWLTDRKDTRETLVMTDNGKSVNLGNSVHENMSQQLSGEDNDTPKHCQKSSCFRGLIHCLTKGFRRYCTVVSRFRKNAVRKVKKVFS